VAASPETSPAGAKSGPGLRTFFAIWAGQALSLLGSQLVQFALIWWLTEQSGSATVLATASLMGLLPAVLIGPFAGALVDRWNRRAVMIVADAGIALATALLAALYASGIIQVWHVYMLLFARAVGGAFHWPAMQASTTLLVSEQHLSRVGGLNQTLNGAANILIPLLGALALAVLPMQAVLAIDVGTALLAIAPLCLVSIPQPVRTDTAIASGLSGGLSSIVSAVLVDMREGFRFVWGWKGLVMFTALSTVFNMLGGAAGAMRPLVITQHFQGGALELGWLQSAAGVGALLGGIVLGVWGGFRRRILTVLLTLILDGVLVTLFGLTPANAFALAVGLMFLAGFLESISIGSMGAIAQAIIPPEMQGRVFSLLIAVGRATLPLALAVAGPIGDAVGARVLYVSAGIALTAVGVISLLIPAIVHIEDPAGHPPAKC
jgi:DHA3 family macrolide efflux protein-like MFS transporter